MLSSVSTLLSLTAATLMVCNSASAHRALRATSPDDWITKFTKDNGCALFGFAGCSYCTQAKAFFKSKGAHFGYCDIQDSSTTPTGQEIFRALESRTHQNTVPNIWLGGKFIGGLDALKKLGSSGRLDAALAAAGCTNKPTASPTSDPTSDPTLDPTTTPSDSGSGSDSWINSEPDSWANSEPSSWDGSNADCDD